jgi:hypothetical protein
MATTKVNYSLRNHNGEMIYLGGNVPKDQFTLSKINPYLDTGSSVKQLPIGTWAFKDARKFYYSYAGGTILGNSRLLVDANYTPGTSTGADTTGFEGYVNAITAVGAEDVVIEDTTDRVVDYYQGGYLTLFEASGVKSATIRINASDVATSADVVTLHLDDGIPWALVEHDYCSAFRSPYSNVTQPSSTHYEGFIGVAHQRVTSSYYFWLQTNGPAWLAQYAAASIPGYTSDYLDAYAWYDGTVKVGATAGALTYVGNSFGRRESGYGETFINMKLG